MKQSSHRLTTRIIEIWLPVLASKAFDSCMRLGYIILYITVAADSAPCEPLVGIYNKASGPPKLSGYFNFTSSHFDMNWTYAGTPYGVDHVPYKMVKNETSGKLCWVHIPQDAVNNIPKNVTDHVGLIRLYWNQGSLMLPVQFEGKESFTIVYFKQSAAP
ncbi:hypothetical protein FOZ63_010350 [Perkinsus olseni]|uniref:Uncharacterized protein n=1 Tax=Perkinsus olseni TaxID=32597 RepID=A0A7J6R3Y8_PEROL|nr:hypothetical protein FOZ63_010350 [Perkinsus olseni]KAF4715051.1 hypothetical protein FOZ62_032100 [Perkinsus olseni]